MTMFDATGGDPLRQRLQALARLAESDDACKLLGVEGCLEAQLDLSFVDDPADWVAYDIAVAVKVADSEESGDEDNQSPTLATLVAELRLLKLLQGSVDLGALARKVSEQQIQD